MIDGIQFKVCGINSPADAEAAAAIGADYLGFILHPSSPRHIGLPRFRAVAAQLPSTPRVAVMVEPTLEAVTAAQAAGFDRFQIHARITVPLRQVKAWSRMAGSANVWLAPKLAPDSEVPSGWLPLAETFLMDTFQPEAFGGSGKTGDWPKFARYLSAHSKKTWILAGGLNPANLRDAIARTGARFVDVSSGVESAPGVKDHAKLKAFAAALKGPSTPSNTKAP